MGTDFSTRKLAQETLSLPKIIRSNTMSHITFKMCQLILIIYLREYHYDFDLDIVVE